MQEIRKLQHGNGQGWIICAEEGAKQIVRELSIIMELNTKESNGYSKDPKLIVVKQMQSRRFGRADMYPIDVIKQESLPENGWKVYDLKYLQLWFHRDVEDVICEIKEEKGYFGIRMALSLIPVYLRAQKKGGLPFHAGLVELKGQGVLLAGPGNIGKSTCCSRLIPPWQAHCDDEVLIVRNDFKEYLVHPFPTWSEIVLERSKQTWNVEKYFPLSAIFFLEQAETDEVIPIGQGQAAILINQSVTQVGRGWSNLGPYDETQHKKKFFDNACEMAKIIPAFILRVSLTGRFWEEMEKVL